MGLIIDNFAGGGGASTGIEAALGRAVDLAINHDEEAIRMHEANHPGTRHIRNNIWQVDPREVTGGLPVELAWFSPHPDILAEIDRLNGLAATPQSVAA